MCGQLRVPESEYEFWTFRQFNNAVKAFYAMQEAKNAHDWQIARWSTWHLLNVQLAKKDKIKSPADLISLPGDEEAKKAIHKKAKQVDERTLERWKKWDEDVKRLRQS